MDKFKRFGFKALFVLSLIVAAPIFIITVVGCVILYKIFELWSDIVWELDDDELTNEWNELVDALANNDNAFNESILDYKIEL